MTVSIKHIQSFCFHNPYPQVRINPTNYFPEQFESIEQIDDQRSTATADALTLLTISVLHVKLALRSLTINATIS